MYVKLVQPAYVYEIQIFICCSRSRFSSGQTYIILTELKLYINNIKTLRYTITFKMFILFFKYPTKMFCNPRHQTKKKQHFDLKASVI